MLSTLKSLSFQRFAGGKREGPASGGFWTLASLPGPDVLTRPALHSNLTALNESKLSQEKENLNVNATRLVLADWAGSIGSSYSDRQPLGEQPSNWFGAYIADLESVPHRHHTQESSIVVMDKVRLNKCVEVLRLLTNDTLAMEQIYSQVFLCVWYSCNFFLLNPPRHMATRNLIG